jgi:DNA-binding MarR family transcriptional regulator
MQQSPDRPSAALLELGIAITRVVRRHAALARPAGLTLVEFRALSVADGYPGLHLKDLALLMGLTPATVSRLAARLVRRGLLQRKSVPEDRRAVRFTLSGKGSATLASARRAAEAVLDARLADISRQERRDLARLTRRLLPRLATRLEAET